MVDGIPLEEIPEQPGDADIRAQPLDIVFHHGQGFLGRLIGHFDGHIHLGGLGRRGGHGPGHNDRRVFNPAGQTGGNGQQHAGHVIGTHADNKTDLGFLAQLGL